MKYTLHLSFIRLLSLFYPSFILLLLIYFYQDDLDFSNKILLLCNKL